MKRFRVPVFVVFVVGMITACEKRDPVDDDVNATAPITAGSDSAGPVAGGPAAAAAASNETATAIGPIPAALQGRWGLTPADCTSTRGDAKGLLVIAADKLTFYESSALPASGIETSDDGISGNFDFSGEGQAWTKYVSLKIQGDGLVRTERNPPTTYTYARCD